jgi:hypothetical protein
VQFDNPLLNCISSMPAYMSWKITEHYGPGVTA